MTIGNAIRTLRDRTGITRRDLSALSRIPIRTIRDWEDGGGAPPLDDLFRIAEAFEIDITQLVSMVDPPTGVRIKKRRNEKEQPND